MGHEDRYRDPVLHAVPAVYMEGLGKVVVSFHEAGHLLQFLVECVWGLLRHLGEYIYICIYIYIRCPV